MSIGQRFFEVRRAKKATQVEFAGKLGLSQSALVAYERGDREPPAVAIAALCKDYGVDPTWLLFGSGIPFRVTQIEMLEKSLNLAKDFVLKYEVNPTRKSEIELAKCYFQYHLENGNISIEMADLLARGRVANER